MPPIIDDYAASIATAGSVAVGSSTSGNIEVSGDHDWFSVNLIAGQTYRIIDTGNTLSDTFLRLHNSVGTILAANDDASSSTLNSLITYTATTSGTYYIDASGYGTHTGSYTISVSGDDYVASTATLGAVSVGGSASGNIELAGDHDWFSVNLTAGISYYLSETGNTLSDTFLRLHNSAGTVLATNDDASAYTLNSMIVYTPASTGVYYLDASGYGSHTGTYHVAVSTVDDYLASTSTTGTVAVGSATNGHIETIGDHDWFSVTLTAGTTYQLRATGATLTDAFLTLHNSAGTALLTDDDTGGNLNALITYNPSSTGVYYLDASGVDGSTGSYSVSVTTVDDYAATSSTTGLLTVGSSATGNIETAGDADWFKVTLTGGGTYQLRETGNTLSDPYLYLHNSAGTVVASNDDITALNLNSLITYTPSTTGIFYLDARGYSSLTGTYSVSVFSDDYAASTSTTGTVAVGGSAGGNIEVSGDHDWFSVNLVAGHSYHLGETGSGLSDPYLYLHNSAGTVVASNDDISAANHNSLISYTAPTTGTYYLDAAAYSTHTGAYTVSVVGIA